MKSHPPLARILDQQFGPAMAAWWAASIPHSLNTSKCNELNGAGEIILREMNGLDRNRHNYFSKNRTKEIASAAACVIWSMRGVEKFTKKNLQR